MAESDPPSTPHDDDSCDNLFKLKYCRRELRKQYYNLVYRVWQWNILEEGLSSAVKSFTQSDDGNGDAQEQQAAEKRNQNIEEILANWERSFNDKDDDEELNALYSKSKEFLTELKRKVLKGKVNTDDNDLTEIAKKIVLTRIQRQVLSKKCGNVKTHQVCSAIKKLCNILPTAVQTSTETPSTVLEKQVDSPVPGFINGSVRPKQGQTEKEKDKYTMTSFSSDLKKVVNFLCPNTGGQNNHPFLQNMEIIFCTERTESIKDPKYVAKWTKACADVHDTLIAVSSREELKKSGELYDSLKKIHNDKCSKKELQQEIRRIIENLTGNFLNFFTRVKFLVEEIWSCLPDEKFKHKKIKKSIETLQKCFTKTRETLQSDSMNISINVPDVSTVSGDLQQIVEELSKMLTAGQLFSLLTECNNKVTHVKEQRIDIEVQNLTAEERKKRKEKCREIWEKCSIPLKAFIKDNTEEGVVTCMQCLKADECQNVNGALREGNLSKEVKIYIRSSLLPAYSSKKWQEIRMLKQVVESLQQGQEIGPEPRQYLFDLLTKWHEDCAKSKDAESCKLAKGALERKHISPDDQRFILKMLKDSKGDPLHEEALAVFKEGPQVEGKLQQRLLDTVTEWYNNFRERGSFRAEGEETVEKEDQECVNIYEAYEAVKSHHGEALLPDSVHEFLLKALSDPSKCECCKKILHLSKAYEVLLEKGEPTEEQREYLQEMFPETAECNSCKGMGTHKTKEQKDEKYWKQFRSYLEKTKDCENCQDMLQCMDVYKVLSGKKELKEGDRLKVINLLTKFEDKWNCKEAVNCIQAIEILSNDGSKKHEEAASVENYVMAKLKEVNPCEHGQDDLHESHDVPSREYLRDFLLKNSCESCSILMGQFKVRKTLQENKYLANNLCEIMCGEVFPNTVQHKECHQWFYCNEMLKATGTLSEDHIKWIHHVLNSTSGCKDCRCEGDMDDSKLREIISKENVAAERDIMKALKYCWERGLQCKECHRKLMHLENPQSEKNTEEKDRLKKFINDHLKQFEHRLHCEVCEGFFVPEKPIVLEPLPLKAFTISTSGCSKDKDFKTFKNAASDKLKELGGFSLDDTFVYPSKTFHKGKGSRKSKKGKAADETTKGEAKKVHRPGTDSKGGGTDEAKSGCRKMGDVKPMQAETDQPNVQGVSPLKGNCVKKMANRQSDGNSKQGGGASGCIKGEAGIGQRSKPGDKKKKTTAAPSPTQSGPTSTSSYGDEIEAGPMQYARSYSKNDVKEPEGIDEVVGIFQEWGKEHNVPLCILKNFMYGNLQGISGEFRIMITKNSGDFDILVISRHLGVILVELKAIDSTSTNLKNALGKAQEQLQKNEMVFYEINKDWLCPSRVPVVSLIAVPNITCQQLKDNGICQRDRQQILSKCMIHYLQTKPRELDKLIGIPNLNYVFKDDEYLTLLARFLSLDNLIKCHRLDEGLIRNTGREMLCMLLTEDQKSLIRSELNPFQILAGDYGTGKSLMLTEKAKSIALIYKKTPEKKKKILLISCTDITVDGTYLNRGQPEDSVQHLRNFTGDKTKKRTFDFFDNIEFHLTGTFMKGHSNNDVVGKLEAAIADIASPGDTELHLLFDEMPLHFMKMFKERIESLIETHKSVLKTFWVSIATHSFRVTVLRNQDPKWIKNSCPEGFKFRYLKKNLRVPGKVLDLHKAFEWFNGDGHVDTKRGDIPLGPMPLLYRVPKCVCASQSNKPLSCECSKHRVKETLRKLFIKIGILKEEQGKTIKSEKPWPRSITMLLFAVESQSFRRDVCNLLLRSCEELGIAAEDRTYVSPDAGGRAEEPLGGHHNISGGEECIVRDGGKSSFQPQAEDNQRCSPTSSQASADLVNPYNGSNSKDVSFDRFHTGMKEPQKESQSHQKILLTTETSFIGCESEVLICVDLNGMLHWYPNGKLAYTTSGISRCLSQYIHLTWMPLEAEKMFRKQMEPLIDNVDVVKEDIEKTFESKETCLEHVLNRILIQEQKVEMSKVGEE